jgi:hypothetical protein
MPSLQKIKLSTDALDNGAWFTHALGFRFRLRRLTYKPYREALEGALRELRGRGLEAAELSAAIDKTVAVLFATHVVVDWAEVTESGPDGVDAPVPFNAERLKAMLCDRAYSDLYDWLTDCARTGEAFREKAAAETLGK